LRFCLAPVLLSPRAYCVNSTTNGRMPPITWLSSSTAWTTRVSNPVCYRRFRTSASVTDQRVAFATGVPPHLYAFHRYTWNSTLLFCTQALQFPMHAYG